LPRHRSAPHDRPDRNLVNLTRAVLGIKVYRIYPLERFEAMLASRIDAVVSPTKWADPFENAFLERTSVMAGPLGPLIPLKNLATDWYGQCWSLREESDAMWRIYCPEPFGRAGVEVSTTIGELFDTFKAAKSPELPANLQFFIGKVTYHTEAAIMALGGKLTFTDMFFGGQGYTFAELPYRKRDAFAHEEEIRLMFWDHDPKRGDNGVVKFPLDPTKLFDEVVLDPRLTHQELVGLEALLKAAGWGGKISQSTLYQAPQFTIPF
jgi:hypothetical protein